jgi:KDO2-lipid IV(A) lauroyltransferase
MDALKVTLVKALLLICAAFPLSIARALGRVMAGLYWRLGGRGRDVTERNISLAFPGLDSAAQHRLARDSIVATGELMAEMGHVWLRSWDYLAPRLQVEGRELILDAQAAGRGVLVLAPHQGNWEVVGLHLARLGPVTSLYQPPRLAALDSMIRQARQRTGAELVPTDIRGVGSLVLALRAGQIAGLLPDQVPAELAAGENVPFMGVPCFTGTLASKLLQRTGALAVVAVAERSPSGFKVRYRAAGDDIYSGDLQSSLAALNAEVECALAHCPEQYQWEYKRFRVVPSQGPGYYD